MKPIQKRKISGLLILILCAAALILIPFGKQNAEQTEFTVVLDPGHGGQDGGAIAEDGTAEKDLNLQISLKLKEKLEQEGIRVILTRETDDDTDGSEGFHKKQDLSARADIGNQSEADLFVSIHCNASTSPKDQGFQVWYGCGNPIGQKAAEILTDEVERVQICTRIRAVKQVPQELYIFRTVTIPSLLVECGFVSNATDLYKLKQESFQDSLCEALKIGILNYLQGKSSEITASDTKNPSAVNANRPFFQTAYPSEVSRFSSGNFSGGRSDASTPSEQRSPRNSRSSFA